MFENKYLNLGAKLMLFLLDLATFATMWMLTMMNQIFAQIQHHDFLRVQI